jgi:hypothetical protein
MKTSKTPPPAFAPALTITETAALSILGWVDSSENRTLLRQRLHSSGDPASPYYRDAEVRHFAKTGQPLPIAARGMTETMHR